MKVHVIEAEMQVGWKDAVQNRDNLGREIAKLAATTGEVVHFHDFKDPVAGAPVVMLECSDAFLAQVKKLPGFKDAHPVWGGMETERKPAIAAYFSQPPAAPKPRKKPHAPAP